MNFPKLTAKIGILKETNHGQGIITASFFTVANEKWGSIELSQISHFSVKQSEIWFRDYANAWEFKRAPLYRKTFWS